MNDNVVPVPPPNPVIIESEDKQRLTKWQEIFKKLSPRITVILPSESEMDTFRANSLRKLRTDKLISPDHTIVGWPEEDSVAFVVIIDSAEPGSIMCKCDIGDAYFFCFNDLAFGVTYFEWDGDAEEGHWAETWSLEHFIQDCLTWGFIYERIIEKVKRYESRVPPPPAQG